MQIIQFQCDKCKSIWTQGDAKAPQQVNICLMLNYGYNYPPSTFGGTTRAHQTWCRPCIEQFVVTPKDKNTPPEVKQNSDIELLVTLLENLGFNRQDQY